MTIINEVMNFFRNKTGFSPVSSDEESEATPNFNWAAYWKNQILGASKIEEKWREKGLSYYRIFRSGDAGVTYSSFLNTNYPATNTGDLKKISPRFNIFYSNTETLKSILLPQLPRMGLRRRFDDEELSTKEKVFYETIAEIIEKAANYFIEKFSFEDFNKFKYDYLVTGRSVLWLSYNQGSDDIGNIIDQTINLENISFTDFLISPAVSWNEVWWVARKKYFSKTEFKKRFPDVNIDKVKFKPRLEMPEFKTADEAEVWEIWDKSRKKVFYTVLDCDTILLEVDDPYALNEFYPTVHPLYALYSPLNLVPVPEFDEYYHQASDLSLTSERASKIVATIKPKALYQQSQEENISALLKADDNEYIPAKKIAITEGVPMFLFFPLKEKQDVVVGLQNHQKNLVNEIYEITGISDIMRNVSTAETATMTTTRTRFGTSRLQQRQSEINSYFKNIFKLLTEFVCNFVNQKTFEKITKIKLPTLEELDKQEAEIEKQLQENIAAQKNIAHEMLSVFDENGIANAKQQIEKLQASFEKLNQAKQNIKNKFSWEEILSYIKDKKLVEFIVDVQTDFTLEANVYNEQSQRLQMYNSFVSSVKEMVPVLQTAPSFSEILTKLFLFTMDSFKLTPSQRLELDEAVDKIDTEARREIEQAPNPELIKAQAELLTAQARQKEAEVAALKVKWELDLERERMSSQERQKFIEIEVEKQKAAHAQQMAEIKMQTEKSLADIKQQETLIKANAEAQKSRNDLDISDDKLTGQIIREGALEGLPTD
jgi:hypothetical protein